jgi:acyl-CoA thioesterase I
MCAGGDRLALVRAAFLEFIPVAEKKPVVPRGALSSELKGIVQRQIAEGRCPEENAMSSKKARAFWLALAAVMVVTNAHTPARAKPLAKTASAAACSAPADLVRLDRALVRTARRLAAGDSITILAIGSSSTAGAGASSPDHSYPSRLAVALQKRFRGHPITVLNRGVNGDEVADMMARLDQTLRADKPDLVLWQLGTNAVLRDLDLQPIGAAIHDGLARIKETGADVVLIDPQFAPEVIAKPEIADMVDIIATLAKQDKVDLFRRYAVMQNWREASGIPFKTFVSSDNLHMNDWGYGCIAKILADAITGAASRPILTATAIGL